MFGRAQHCTRTLSVLVGSPASYPFPVSCPLESTKPWDQVPALELPLPKQYHKAKAQHFVVESDFSSQRTVPSYMHCGLAWPSTSITCNSTAALHPVSQYIGAVAKTACFPFSLPILFTVTAPTLEHRASFILHASTRPKQDIPNIPPSTLESDSLLQQMMC